jgi:hypothetical protein
VCHASGNACIFKNNWLKLKTRLALSSENYHGTSIHHKSSHKRLPNTFWKVNAPSGQNLLASFGH